MNGSYARRGACLLLIAVAAVTSACSREEDSRVEGTGSRVKPASSLPNETVERNRRATVSVATWWHLTDSAARLPIRGVWRGSGVIVRNDGVVATAGDVVRGRRMDGQDKAAAVIPVIDSIVVELADGGRWIGHLRESSADGSIALIKVDTPAFMPFVSPATEIMTPGNFAFVLSADSASPTRSVVARGTIAAHYVPGERNAIDRYVWTVSDRGDEKRATPLGLPVLDSQGRLVGLTVGPLVSADYHGDSSKTPVASLASLAFALHRDR